MFIEPCSADGKTFCLRSFVFWVKINGYEQRITGGSGGIAINGQKVEFFEFLSLRIRQASTSVFEIRELNLGVDLIWGINIGLVIKADYKAWT